MRRIWGLVGLCAVCACGGSGTPVPASELVAPVSSAEPETRALPRARVRFAGGQEIIVEVAKTPRDRQRGLMFREHLDPDTGMLFIFPHESYLSFWMKNTFIDLDMVFLDNERRVTRVHHNVPRSAPDTPEDRLARRSARGKFVIELPAGAAMRYGIKMGQTISF